MRTKFIERGEAKNGKVVVDAPKNPYLGLLLRLTGTTDTGETLALSDIGSIRVERNGSQIQAQSFEFFHERTDLKKGYPNTVSGSAATAEDVVAWIPFYKDGLPTVLDVFSKEEVDITLDFNGGTLSTRFGSNSCTWELYGITEQALSERYVLDVRSQNIQRNSSGRAKETLDRQNICALYFEDASDVVDELQVDVDSEIVWDNIDQDIITILTNIAGQVESSGNPLGEINMVETGDIREAYNTNTEVNANFNASGTLSVTIFSVQPSERAQASRQRAQEYLAKKQQKLNQS